MFDRLYGVGIPLSNLPGVPVKCTLQGWGTFSYTRFSSPSQWSSIVHKVFFSYNVHVYSNPFRYSISQFGDRNDILDLPRTYTIIRREVLLIVILSEKRCVVD